MTGIPDLVSVEDFLLNEPLYSRKMARDENVLKQLLLVHPFSVFKVDGHCSYCKARTTYVLENTLLDPHLTHSSFHRKWFSFEASLTCARNDGHKARYYIQCTRGVVQKIGQYPSLADIANDESKTYRAILEKEDASELHKAIGLASHGVGIGSYVYLRRVFENLIRRRFNEHAKENSWTEDDFKRKRMDEKIEHLSSYLPPFLVRNKRIYSILSLGIHELDEEACRGFFQVLYQSIVFILEEDMQAREKAKRQKKLEDALVKYVPPGRK